MARLLLLEKVEDSLEIVVGATPFELVDDFSAIFPIELWSPILRLANILEWNGQEFFEQTNKLGNLDKTRLMVMIDIYAKKHIHKYWHDSYVKKDMFWVGDLVILYTLKRHKINPNKRG